MSHSTTRSRAQERGAMMVEAAIIFATLTFSILFIIDFCRYFAIRALLIKGAHDGLDLAATAPDFDSDIFVLNPGSVSADATRYRQYIEARLRVVDRAIGVPIVTAVGGTTATSAIRLQRFVMTDQTQNGSGSMSPAAAGASGYNSSRDFQAAILRPGESGYFLDQSSSVWIDNPSVCSPASPTCPAARQRTADTDQRRLMKRFPIVVVVRTRMSLLSTLFTLGTIPVEGRVLGYRETLPSSSFAEPFMSPYPDTPTSSASSSGSTGSSASSVSSGIPTSSGGSSSAGSACSVPSQAECIALYGPTFCGYNTISCNCYPIASCLGL